MRGTTWTVINKEGAKKRTTVPKKNENEQAEMDVSRSFAGQKKQARNESKNNSENSTTRQSKLNAMGNTSIKVYSTKKTNSK